MDNNHKLSLTNVQKLQTISNLRACNEFTTRFGIALTEEMIISLTNKRFESLKEMGRIEFGQGILKELIFAFCDSPFITQDTFEETIIQLQEIFYYFKTEAMELISDDELIDYMKECFDGKCEGSLEYLSGTSLEDLMTDYKNR